MVTRALITRDSSEMINNTTFPKLVGEPYPVSSVKDLKSLIGRKIRCLKDFAGLPKGTPGTIIDYSTRFIEEEEIQVEWHRPSGKSLTDWFGRRSNGFDETQWLELIE